LYHQWKQDQVKAAADKTIIIQQNPQQICTEWDQKRRKGGDDNHKVVTIVSDLGLIREISSPNDLAKILVPLLEEDLQENPHWGLAPDVQCQESSGIVSLITWQWAQELHHTFGLLLCPQCIKWCRGEKGL
jgi:hypothetical protein